ncbi:unnamed protein product [Ilex paraguariensis]|uniref:Uncharacterized protein n=1 Tax=Ilex paraguariensis TaxID=185542 RepID=A0ABC8QSE3_9AQUA
MKMQACSTSFYLLLFFLLLVTIISSSEVQSCKPSGKIKGKKLPHGHATLRTTLSVATNAVLTINSFEKGGDGGAESECDNKYHSDDTPVVVLSTG